MKPVEPRVDHGVAIVGPYGNVWTDKIFNSDVEAIAYLRDFWKNVSKADLSGYRLAAATQTIEVASTTVTTQEPLIDISEHLRK